MIDDKKLPEGLPRELEKRTLEKLATMIRLGANPAAMEALVDREAKKIVEMMTPAEKGQYRYPTGKLVRLDEVPDGVMEDHLQRYSMGELERGQFIVIEGSKTHYLFIMDQQTKERIEKKLG